MSLKFWTVVYIVTKGNKIIIIIKKNKKKYIYIYTSDLTDVWYIWQSISRTVTTGWQLFDCQMTNKSSSHQNNSPL